MPPPRAALTLTIPDLDARGQALASDGRAWPSLRLALRALAAEGWRVVDARADGAGVRFTLHRAPGRPTTPPD